MIHLGDSRYVTPQDEDARNLNGGPEFRGFVTLQVQNGLIVPTFYGTHEAEQYSFLPRGTTMVACWPGGVPYFKIVVIQPLTVVSSEP
jgi:hypothetical protein